jgi:ABC-2 type transport system ATP-binding protein
MALKLWLSKNTHWCFCGLLMPKVVAEFTGVSKTYKAPFFRGGQVVHALSDVGLRIDAGEVFALLGPNRAGKTTLVKILLGLCRASEGKVTRFGRPLGDRSTLARIGYMHENQAFPRYLTATALLRLYGTLSWVPPALLADRIPNLLKRVGLADRAQEPIARFSKGMVQRLALAQALLAEPDLLVLDEPTEGLDLVGRLLLREIIAEQRRQGKTVLIVSHVLGEVEQACERLAVLVDGRVAHCGPLTDLLRDPKTGDLRSLESALKPIYTQEVS